MKAPIAVALIVVGGILILAPAISDHLARAQVVAVMAAHDLPEISLHPDPMSSAYRFGCWLVGGIMIAVAMLRSRNASQ
jgi:hypothetical protein